MSYNKKIDLFFLQDFLNELVLSGKDKKYIIDKLGKIDRENGYNTYILTPTNLAFKRIVVYFEDNELKSITIFADFDFDFRELIKKYGSYREHYSRYDDIYLYYFNENNETPFFIESERNIKYEVIDGGKEDLIKKIKIIFKKDN